jgi:predicted nucleic acid-binding protein
MPYLVELSVLRELAGPAPNRGVVDWAGRISRFAISAITLEEVAAWLGANPEPAVLVWFEQLLEHHVDVLPVTAAIARRSGALRANSGDALRTRSAALIAATAVEHGLTLVTRNPRAFGGCGVAVLDPFASPRSASPPQAQ